MSDSLGQVVWNLGSLMKRIAPVATWGPPKSPGPSDSTFGPRLDGGRHVPTRRLERHAVAFRVRYTIRDVDPNCLLLQLLPAEPDGQKASKGLLPTTGARSHFSGGNVMEFT